MGRCVHEADEKWGGESKGADEKLGGESVTRRNSSRPPFNLVFATLVVGCGLWSLDHTDSDSDTVTVTQRVLPLDGADPSHINCTTTNSYLLALPITRRSPTSRTSRRPKSNEKRRRPT